MPNLKYIYIYIYIYIYVTYVYPNLKIRIKWRLFYLFILIWNIDKNDYYSKLLFLHKIWSQKY